MRSRPFRSSSEIIMKLERPLKDATEMTPAAVTGLQALENAHTVINTYSPDTAGNLPLRGDQAGVLRKIALMVSPLFLAFGWVSFFKSVAQLARVVRDKRNLSFYRKYRARLWLDVLVNFLSAAGSTLAMVFLLTGLAYLAPYLIAAMLGVNALYGLDNIARNLYLAYVQKEQPLKRRYHLKAAGKQLLGIVINTLALVLNIFIFQAARLLTKGIHDFASDVLSIFLHFQEFMDLINGPVTASVNVIKIVGMGWLASTSLWLLIAAAKLNKQTYELLAGKVLTDPVVYEREVRRDLKDLYFIITNQSGHERFGKRFLFSLAAPFLGSMYLLTGLIYTFGIRPAAALFAGIPQLLLLGLSMSVKLCCDFFSKDNDKSINEDSHLSLKISPSYSKLKPQNENQLSLSFYQQLSDSSTERCPVKLETPKSLSSLNNTASRPLSL